MRPRSKTMITDNVQLKKELRKSLKKDLIDLVLLDVSMPEILNGDNGKKKNTAREGDNHSENWFITSEFKNV